LGSPFVGLVNAWFPIFVVFGVIPTAVFAATYPTGWLLVAQLGLLATLLPRMLLLPVSGLWLAELSADRYVVELGQEPALRRALAAHAAYGSRRRRFFRLLTDLAHPPGAVPPARRAGSAPQVPIMPPLLTSCGGDPEAAVAPPTSAAAPVTGRLDIVGYSGPCRATGTQTTYQAGFTGQRS
jgi:hypothetical protein